MKVLFHVSMQVVRSSLSINCRISWHRWEHCINKIEALVVQHAIMIVGPSDCLYMIKIANCTCSYILEIGESFNTRTRTRTRTQVKMNNILQEKASVINLLPHYTVS